jgi:peptidoglycan/xylan/chitin deacetylase (PgdA/CDA1 family)
VGPFDPDVVDATPRVFEAQLLFLKEHFTLVDLPTVQAHLEGDRLPPNPALVTFDDGYRECHDVVLPMLLRHAVPAAFFIATHFVERRRVYWWDRIVWSMHNATRQRFPLEYPADTMVDLTRDPAREVRRLVGIVKETFDLDVDRFLEELASSSGAPWGDGLERELADRLILTWEQVRALRDAGMAIGSHTRTHRVLETLPPAALDAELAGSRLDLERVLREPIRTLAYPAGRAVESSAIRAAVTAAGYEVAFTGCTGVQRLRRTDPLGVRRLAAEAEWGVARFRCAVTFPELA